MPHAVAVRPLLYKYKQLYQHLDRLGDIKTSILTLLGTRVQRSNLLVKI